MIYKTLVTSSGRKIHVYDEVFPKSLVEYFEEFFQNSFYRLGSASSYRFTQAHRTFFQSRYNSDDIALLGIFEHIKGTKIADDLEGLELSSYWVLVSTYFTQYYLHTDRLEGSTFIYYGNGAWEVDWGGETLFCNDNGEVEIAVSCKPNRIVVFDSAIPHKPATLSLEADQYRFTFVAQFKNPEKVNKDE
jgi:hypothetical protein